MSDILASGTDDQARLIRALTNPPLYGDSCASVRVIETHISYVLLTGRYAYKIKKAVALGFLDFTTLPARRFYCQRELELNRRLAPSVYLDVVAITGSADAPRIGGDGPAIEYAVKMREFPQDALLTSVLARGALTGDHVDALAAALASFHTASPRARAGARYGSAADVLELAVENFSEIEPLLARDADRRVLGDVRRWTLAQHALRAELFASRLRRGFIRECHGDLHLGNIALVDDAVTIFDCIEFNDDMRWSDVMADVAFLVMDLEDKRRPDLASRFLDKYLELTGDYDGVQVLRFYVVYRAMVRAKVACMRASQTDEAGAHDAKVAECREYLDLARRCSTSTTTGIVITRGPSGSGKTTRSQALVELAGAIRVRTDVERKRLHGLTPHAASGSALNAGLYSAAETERTYAHVARAARAVAGAGYLAVVDGTFLLRHQRERLRAASADLHVPFAIVDFVARVETLRARVRERQQAGLDPSEADVHVLEHQLAIEEPLSPDERQLTFTCDAEGPIERSSTRQSWQPLLDLLHVDACTGPRLAAS